VYHRKKQNGGVVTVPNTLQVTNQSGTPTTTVTTSKPSGTLTYTLPGFGTGTRIVDSTTTILGLPAPGFWEIIWNIDNEILSQIIEVTLPVEPEDPTFTLNPNDPALTISPIPVTPGGVFTVNGTPYPVGTTTFPIVTTINTITYTTPDGSTSTQTYDPVDIPPPPTNVVKQDLVEILLPKVTPQSNITSGFVGNYYSAVEYEIGQGSRPVKYRFTSNVAGDDITTNFFEIWNGFLGKGWLKFTKNTAIADNVNTFNVTIDGTNEVSTPFFKQHQLVGNAQSANIKFVATENNAFDHGSLFETFVPSATASTWINAVDAFTANGINLNLLSDNRYFDVPGGRYIANQNNLQDVTFKLPPGKKYVMMSNGGVNYTGTNLIIYSTVQGGSYAGIQDISSFVNNQQLITLKKAAGTQGTVYGFFSLNY